MVGISAVGEGLDPPFSLAALQWHSGRVKTLPYIIQNTAALRLRATVCDYSGACLIFA